MLLGVASSHVTREDVLCMSRSELCMDSDWLKIFNTDPPVNFTECMQLIVWYWCKLLISFNGRFSIWTWVSPFSLREILYLFQQRISGISGTGFLMGQMFFLLPTEPTLTSGLDSCSSTTGPLSDTHCCSCASSTVEWNAVLMLM